MLSPVLADMPSNAVMFAVYEMIFRQINSNPDKNKSHLKECFNQFNMLKG